MGALPLGISSLLYTLAPNIPRYFLDHFAGRRELGIYSALSYVVIAGTTVVTAIGTAAVNGLAADFASGDARGFLTRLGRLTGLALLMGLIGFGLTVRYGALLLTLAYGREYAQYHDLFVWIIGAGGLSYVASVLGYGLVATRKFTLQVPLHLAITASITLTCWLCISRFGLLGGGFRPACRILYSNCTDHFTLVRFSHADVTFRAGTRSNANVLSGAINENSESTT